MGQRGPFGSAQVSTRICIECRAHVALSDDAGPSGPTAPSSKTYFSLYGEGT